LFFSISCHIETFETFSSAMQEVDAIITEVSEVDAPSPITG
jgi:hypothetical protein